MGSDGMSKVHKQTLS